MHIIIHEYKLKANKPFNMKLSTYGRIGVTVGARATTNLHHILMMAFILPYELQLADIPASEIPEGC
jgi:hypothetical protein